MILEHYNQSGVRMHPNMYNCGKICLSILGTWTGDKWTPLMSVEYLLRTVQSLLDDDPMKHEPGRTGDKEYNKFIRYYSLQYLLIDYLENETEPEFKNFIVNHTKNNLKKIESLKFNSKQVINKGYTNKSINVNKEDLIKKIKKCLEN